MSDYQKKYDQLFNRIATAIALLEKVQEDTERLCAQEEEDAKEEVSEDGEA